TPTTGGGSLPALRTNNKLLPKRCAKRLAKTKPRASTATKLSTCSNLSAGILATNASVNSSILPINKGVKSKKQIPGFGKSWTLRILDHNVADKLLMGREALKKEWANFNALSRKWPV